jgi:hypothetical protein
MYRTGPAPSHRRFAAIRGRRYAGRLIIAAAAAALIGLALNPAHAYGPTAGEPSAASLRILEEAQTGKGLTERFNLPRGPVQLGLPRFDGGEAGNRPNLPGPARR